MKVDVVKCVHIHVLGQSAIDFCIVFLRAENVIYDLERIRISKYESTDITSLREGNRKKEKRRENVLLFLAGPYQM
jgi:hypothetical protein